MRANTYATLMALTTREREIASLVAQGLTNEQIAEATRISAKTVKTHIMACFSKCYVANRVQLTRYAIAHGWVPAPTIDTVVVVGAER